MSGVGVDRKHCGSPKFRGLPRETQRVRLRVLDVGKTSKLHPIVAVVVVVFGAIVLALAAGAILMATRLGWDIRLLWLLGAPVGFASYWFLIRGHLRDETWRESLPAIVIATGLVSSMLNLVFRVSPVYAVFILSAAAGLTGFAFVRFLAELRVMRFVMDLGEADEDEGSSLPG